VPARELQLGSEAETIAPRCSRGLVSVHDRPRGRSRGEV